MQLPSKRAALHARAAQLIPWLANGTAPADAEPAVRGHIETCPECREDLEEQQRVCAAMRADGPLVFAAESSYQKLLARLQGAEEAAARPDPTLRPIPVPAGQFWRHPSPLVRWLVAAVILQAFALGIGAWVWHAASAPGADRYMTLTSAAPRYDSGPRARVVFSKALSMGSLQILLQRAGAHIIDGPADGGVYTLGFAPPPRSAAGLRQRISALRADPAVLFAEPIPVGVR